MTLPNDETQAFPDQNNFGLSKLEYISAMAMQGLLHSWPDECQERLATAAILQARALLEGLDNE